MKKKRYLTEEDLSVFFDCDILWEVQLITEPLYKIENDTISNRVKDVMYDRIRTETTIRLNQKIKNVLVEEQCNI